MNQPFCFYKFVSFDRKDILENGLIRFAPIGSFNDPFELEPTITSLSTEYIDYLNKLSVSERLGLTYNKEDYEYSAIRAEKIEEYKGKYRKKIGKYGVLSLSSNNEINRLLCISVPDKKDPRTNILMWSHYADSHKGFVIEFDRDFIDDIDIKKVEYCSHRDYLTFEDIDQNRFGKIFFKKSPEWSYEQEYRVVLPLEKAEIIRDEKFHLFKINKSCIKSITLGCAMSDENKQIIIDLMKNDPELQDKVLYEADLNEEGFFLKFYSTYRGLSNKPHPLIRPLDIPNQKTMRFS